MNARIARLKDWINSATLRERVLILFASLMAIFLMKVILLSFIRPSDDKTIHAQMNAAHEQINLVNGQAQVILARGISMERHETVQHHKLLRDRLAQLNSGLTQLSRVFVSMQEMQLVLKDFIMQTDGLTLVNMKADLQEELIISNEKSDKIKPQKKVYKHGVQIELQGDYFSTINYLQKVEALRWYLLWDSLEYKVINYPVGSIVIKLYILNDKQESLDV